MSTEAGIALALFALLLGMGISWSHFREALQRLEWQLDDAESTIAVANGAAAGWRSRALDAEKSLELVLAEGEQSPLTAPLQVVGRPRPPRRPAPMPNPALPDVFGGAL
jgi:hypothetical protein